MKLNTIRTENTEFNHETYHPIEIIDPEAAKTASNEAPPKTYEDAGNVIRWRYSDITNPVQDDNIPSLELGIHHDDKDKEIESNTRIIEWSDGSYQLAVGKQLFDIRFEKDESLKIFSKLEDYLISKGEVEQKIILVPAEGSSGYPPENYLEEAKKAPENKEKTPEKEEKHEERRPIINAKMLEEGAEMDKPNKKQEDSESDFDSEEK